MTRFKRRMLVGTTLVVLVLLWVGVLVYKPTQIALQRAESFQFRRMTVARLDERGTYRFFYATNPWPFNPDSLSW